MRSIKRRFENIARKNPLLSSYVCFAETIRGQNFSRSILHRWFSRLVEKDDYERSEKKSILFYLESLSKHTEERKK